MSRNSSNGSRWGWLLRIGDLDHLPETICEHPQLPHPPQRGVHTAQCFWSAVCQHLLPLKRRWQPLIITQAERGAFLWAAPWTSAFVPRRHLASVGLQRVWQMSRDVLSWMWRWAQFEPNLRTLNWILHLSKDPVRISVKFKPMIFLKVCADEKGFSNISGVHAEGRNINLHCWMEQSRCQCGFHADVGWGFALVRLLQMFSSR